MPHSELAHEADLTQHAVALVNALEEHADREELLAVFEAAESDLVEMADQPMHEKLPGEDEAFDMYELAAAELGLPLLVHINPITGKVELGSPPEPEEE